MSRIVRIPILPLRMVNAHLLIRSDGCLLIDAGLPGSATKVEKVLSKQGPSFKDIKAIVITHAHVDHAGGAAELREKSRAPIIAHEDDLPYYKREIPMTLCPTGWFGRSFIKTPLPHQSYTAFEPDVMLSANNTFDLSTFGVNGIVKHTPGHTKGSVSVELGNKEALVGDLVASGVLMGGVIRLGHALRPPFEDDPQAVARELLRLVDAGIDRFYMGIGGPLDAREVRRHGETEGIERQRHMGCDCPGCYREVCRIRQDAETADEFLRTLDHIWQWVRIVIHRQLPPNGFAGGESRLQ